MSGLNIVVVIAIILFARLGMRLLINFKKQHDDRNKKDKT